jgi:hypothetical protein
MTLVWKATKKIFRRINNKCPMRELIFRIYQIDILNILIRIEFQAA